MPDYSKLLNEKQLAAVETTSQYVRIVAGAGSGKTRVLTYRIAYLIGERGVTPSRILAITFTNKAAAEMKTRAVSLIKETTGKTPMVYISTFHSFCARLLREEHTAFGYPYGFTIFDEDDQKQLLASVCNEFKIKRKDPLFKYVSHYINVQKGKGIYPEDVSISYNDSPDDKKCLEIYFRYEERKSFCKALDFDDLLNYSLKILTDNPEIQAKWSNRFDHILVDEYQDTNDVQFRLMKALTRPETCVYVVGDPDQTIYTWRGANQSIILDFEKTYPGAETIILNENYRSTKYILNAANALIAHNKKRVPKDLYTNGLEGDKVEVHTEDRSRDEASWVAKRIIDIVDRERKPDEERDFRQIAVLYRSSYMTRAVEMAFKNHNIPYRIFGGLRFYERAEVKDVLAYFTLLVNPNDDVAFERIVNRPRRGIGDVALDNIRSLAKSAGVSEYLFVAQMLSGGEELPIKGKAYESLISMASIMGDAQKELSVGMEAPASILKKMIEKLGYYDFLTENEDPEEDRAANVNALFDDLTQFNDENPDAGLEEYLQNISLLSSQDDMNNGNYVSLMTIHVAKGLEFDHVFIIYMNENAFPNARTLNEGGASGIEEERRLAYVAFTRAKNTLCITSNSEYTWGSDSHAVPSRFIKEAGLYAPRSHSSYGCSSWTPGFTKRKNDPFGDGDHIDPFDKGHRGYSAPKATPAPEHEPNGIRDWQAGDRVHHEKFGDGDVVDVINQSIIVINFDSCGKKTLMANHWMLSRIRRKGGAA